MAKISYSKDKGALFLYMYFMYVKHKLQRREDTIVFPPNVQDMPGVQKWCGVIRSIHAYAPRELHERYPLDDNHKFIHLAVKLLCFVPFDNKIILLYWTPTACWAVAMVDRVDCLFSMHGYQLDFRKQDEGLYDPTGSAYTDVLAYTTYSTLDAVNALIKYVRCNYDGHSKNNEVATRNTTC